MFSIGLLRRRPNKINNISSNYSNRQTEQTVSDHTFRTYRNSNSNRNSTRHKHRLGLRNSRPKLFGPSIGGGFSQAQLDSILENWGEHN